MVRSFWDTWASGRQPRLDGRHVLVVLIVVTLATVVGPPAFGWALNQWREQRTIARAEVLAAQLRPDLARLAGRAEELRVVCGPGRLPDPGITGAWVSRAVQAPRVFPEDAATDAWGRCFLINLGALTGGGPVWLLSAGTDGAVSTYPDAQRLADDDLGVRLR